MNVSKFDKVAWNARHSDAVERVRAQFILFCVCTQIEEISLNHLT